MFKSHPDLQLHEIWPGKAGYPWADTGVRLWSRQGLLRRVGASRLLCTWTTGTSHSEPMVGNITMYSISDDDGKSWSKAEILFQHASEGLLVPEIFVAPDGNIHAFIQTYSNGSWLCRMHNYTSVSKDGGKTWSTPHSLGGGADNLWTNPGIVSGTRWIFPVSYCEHNGSQWCHLSDGRAPYKTVIGGIEQPANEFPAQTDRIAFQIAANKWADENHRSCCGVLISEDNGESFRLCGRISGGAANMLIEPKIVRLSNGDLLMLMRSQKDNFLWQSISRDNGDTWENARCSEIPNPGANFMLQKDAGSVIHLLHNPSNSLGVSNGKRNPLAWWQSRDDGKSWQEHSVLLRNEFDTDPSLNYPDGFIDEKERCLRFVWEDAYHIYYASIGM